MGRLGQQSVFLQRHTHVPGGLPAGSRLDYDRVEQAFAAHFSHQIHPRGNLLHLCPEEPAETLGILRQFFFLDYFQRRHRHPAGQGIAPKGGAMFPGLDTEHDLVIRQHCRYRQYSPGERLPQNDDIRSHIFMIRSQQLAGTGQAGLHLVADQQHIVRFTQFRHPGQVAGIRHHHPGFTLDRLDHESGNMRILQGFLQSGNIIVGYDFITRHEGTKSAAAIRIGRGGDDRQGAAMEITFGEDDLGLVLRHSFFKICPLAG